MELLENKLDALTKSIDTLTEMYNKLKEKVDFLMDNRGNRVYGMK